MGDPILMEALASSSFEDILRDAIALANERSCMVAVKYLTMCSSGILITTPQSSFDELMRAFEAAQNHEGKYEETYDGFAIIGP